MDSFELQYRQTLRDVLDRGVPRVNLYNTRFSSLFGREFRFDLRDGFPFIGLRRLWWKAVVCEAIWVLNGGTNVGPLERDGIFWWSPWANARGELATSAGKQLRQWQTPDGQVRDQLTETISQLTNHCGATDIVVDFYHVSCRNSIQWFVYDGVLHTRLTQRACDLMLGGPYDVALVALITTFLAGVARLVPGEFVYHVGELQIYEAHRDIATRMATRDLTPVPRLEITSGWVSPGQLDRNHFQLVGYCPCETLEEARANPVVPPNAPVPIDECKRRRRGQSRPFQRSPSGRMTPRRLSNSTDGTKTKK